MNLLPDHPPKYLVKISSTFFKISDIQNPKEIIELNKKS